MPILRLFLGSLRYSSNKNINKSLESSQLLNKVMTRLNEMSLDELDAVGTQFKELMSIILDIFGNNAFRKSYKHMRQGGYNKFLLESFFINLNILNDKQRQLIVKRKKVSCGACKKT